MSFGSDVLALASFTEEVCFMEDGDWAVLSRESATIRDEDSHPIERSRVMVPANSTIASKGNHRHFMAKKIYEPEVVGRTIAHYIDFGSGMVCPPALPFAGRDRCRVRVPLS